MRADCFWHLLCATSFIGLALQSTDPVNSLCKVLKDKSLFASKAREEIQNASLSLPSDQVYAILRWSLDSSIDPVCIAWMLHPHMNALLEETPERSLFKSGHDIGYVRSFLEEFVERTAKELAIIHSFSYPLVYEAIGRNLQANFLAYNLESILVHALLIKPEPTKRGFEKTLKEIITFVVQKLRIACIVNIWDALSSAGHESAERVVWMIELRKPELMSSRDLKAELVFAMKDSALYRDTFLKDYLGQMPCFPQDFISHIMADESLSQILHERVCRKDPNLDLVALLEQAVDSFSQTICCSFAERLVGEISKKIPFDSIRKILDTKAIHGPRHAAWILRGQSSNPSLQKEIFEILAVRYDLSSGAVKQLLIALLQDMQAADLAMIRHCMNDVDLLERFIRKALVSYHPSLILTKLLENISTNLDEFVHPTDVQVLAVNELSKTIATENIMLIYFGKKDELPAQVLASMLVPHISELARLDNIESSSFYGYAADPEFLENFLTEYTRKTTKQSDIELAISSEFLLDAVVLNISASPERYDFVALAIKLLEQGFTNPLLSKLIFSSLSCDDVKTVLEWAYRNNCDLASFVELLKLRLASSKETESSLADIITHFGKSQAVCGTFLIGFIESKDGISQSDLEVCINSPWLLETAKSKYIQNEGAYDSKRIFETILDLGKSSWWGESGLGFTQSMAQYAGSLCAFTKYIGNRLTNEQFKLFWDEKRTDSNEVIFEWALEARNDPNKNLDYGQIRKYCDDNNSIFKYSLQKFLSISLDDLYSAIKDPSTFVIASRFVELDIMHYDPVQPLFTLLTMPLNEFWRDRMGKQAKKIAVLIKELSYITKFEDALALLNRANISNIRKSFLIQEHCGAFGLERISTFFTPLNDYRVIEKMEETAYSKILKAKHRLTGQICVIKQISICEKSERWIESELEILMRVKSPYVLEMKGYSISPLMSHAYIFTELASDGSLEAYAKFQLPTCLVQNYAAQIILGLEYLHSLNIVHRDLKPSNILVHRQRLIIADFGLSAILGPNQYSTEPAGTVGYAAPEVIMRKKYNKSADFFSLGCLLYWLGTGKECFEGNTKEEVTVNAVLSEPDYGAIRDGQLKDLVSKLLMKEADERLGCSPSSSLDSGSNWQQVKGHPFFDGFEWDDLIPSQGRAK